MSDIGIRFDGIILLAALLLGAILWSVTAVITGGVAFFRSSARAWKVARHAGALAVVTLVVSGGFAVWWDKHGPAFAGPDWVDQLTYPWAIVFLAGCCWLARVR